MAPFSASLVLHFEFNAELHPDPAFLSYAGPVPVSKKSGSGSSFQKNARLVRFCFLIRLNLHLFGTMDRYPHWDKTIRDPYWNKWRTETLIKVIALSSVPYVPYLHVLCAHVLYVPTVPYLPDTSRDSRIKIFLLTNNFLQRTRRVKETTGSCSINLGKSDVIFSVWQCFPLCNYCNQHRCTNSIEAWMLYFYIRNNQLQNGDFMTWEVCSGLSLKFD